MALNPALFSQFSLLGCGCAATQLVAIAWAYEHQPTARLTPRS
jgi:hypothetical protein